GWIDFYLPQHRRNPGDTGTISGDELAVNPFCLPFSEPRLYLLTDDGAARDPAIRARLLAEDVPARTYAAGANEVIRENRKSVPLGNINMNSEFQRRGWPKSRVDSIRETRWLHSDLRDVAYLFTAMVFDRFVEIENQK